MQTKNLKKLVHFSPDGVEREALHESDHLWSELLCLSVNQAFGPLVDEESDALFLVVAGEAVFQVGAKRKRVDQWSTVLVPAGSEMTATNASGDPLVLLVTAAPPPTPRAVSG